MSLGQKFGSDVVVKIFEVLDPHIERQRERARDLSKRLAVLEGKAGVVGPTPETITQADLAKELKAQASRFKTILDIKDREIADLEKKLPVSERVALMKRRMPANRKVKKPARQVRRK